MILLPQTSTALDAAAHFATKRTEIGVTHFPKIEQAVDFSTCLRQCVPALKVFTDEVGADSYTNDKYLLYANVFTGSIFKAWLTWYDNHGNAHDIELTNDDYGEYLDGSAEDPAYFAFRLDFFKVWALLGYGKYEFRIEVESAFSRKVVIKKSPCFNLMKFTEKSANGTIKIETRQSGLIHNGLNYGSTVWIQETRLPGSLQWSTNNDEVDTLELNNDNRSLYQVKDQVLPEYIIHVHLVSARQIMRVIFDYLFANQVLVSDYNVYNFVIDPADESAEMYRRIPLHRIGTDFTPTRKNLRKSITFTMEYANKNVIKTNN